MKTEASKLAPVEVVMLPEALAFERKTGLPFQRSVTVYFQKNNINKRLKKNYFMRFMC